MTGLAQVTPFWPVLFLNGSFYFRATSSLLSSVSHTDTPMNAHSHIHSLQRKLLFQLRVNPVGPSSASNSISYSPYDTREKALIYPREHERIQRACSSFLPSYVRPFSGLQGAMKEKRMRQLGELRAGPRVHPGVRPGKLSG